jgi:hypothetical protein
MTSGTLPSVVIQPKYIARSFKMKTVLISMGVFAVCWLIGNAMVEFIVMARDKISEDEKLD